MLLDKTSTRVGFNVISTSCAAQRKSLANLHPNDFYLITLFNFLKVYFPSIDLFVFVVLYWFLVKT